MRQLLMLVTTSAIAMTWGAHAAAQDALAATSAADLSAESADEPSDANANGVNDIVVTARRREESLQDAPVTVTAFTGDYLEQKGVNDVTRLLQVTPGVNFDIFPRAAPRPFFRGIGSSNQGAGADPSSVAFLDGVYLARGGMLGIDFYDLQRVEVLKGPQGTLFGKNVVGGAINFITNKPVDDLEATAQLTLAKYGQTNGNLMVNVPISDTIATRIVLGAISNDGFRHTPKGQPLDDEHKISARMQTLFGVGAGTSFLISADIASQDIAQSARYNTAILPYRPSGDKKGHDDFQKPRIANPDFLGGTDTVTGGVRGELVTDVLGFATLTTTASWRTLDFSNSEDLDGTTAAANAANKVIVSGLQIFQEERADTYSAETRLNSAGTGPITWVAGLYFNHDKVHRERETQQSATPTTINRYFGDSSSRSYAAYGELQYHFDFGLNLFGGARYTDERKEYEITRKTGPIVAPVTNYTTVGNPGVARQRLVTWRAGADYRFNDNLFAYGSVSTGFKSGAFPEQPSNATLARLSTAPEKVINYEAGLKTDWLDRRLRLNIAGFVAKYTDFQTINTVPDAQGGVGASRVTIDTGDATIKGVETELVFAPARFLDFNARYTYLDAKFDQLTQTSAFLADGTAVRRDLVGNRMSRTPKHALNAEFGLSSPERDWGWLRGSVSLDYQSEIFDDNDNDFLEYRRPRSLWDAQITYHRNDSWSVQAWIRNLTDVEYRVHQTASAGGLFVLYGAPRQYGVTVRAAF
ncbi:TonB-dependent receptor [Tsuneonella rigui]|uniref:TonB-dependent receptor n=1 Tax=Tsuneonella rigui TaxID=1708790 RepID=UPI000F7E4A47|nr:TonB-dependent receptor [Tsuneonella rigui]